MHHHSNAARHDRERYFADKITAYHEAGHVVALYRGANTVATSATIDARRCPDGAVGFVQHCSSNPAVLQAYLKQGGASATWARKDIAAHVLYSLAGYAVDLINVKRHRECSRWIVEAATSMEAHDDTWTALEYLKLLYPDRKRRLAALRKFMKLAVKGARASWKLVSAVAEDLLLKGTLDSEQLRSHLESQ